MKQAWVDFSTMKNTQQSKPLWHSRNANRRRSLTLPNNVVTNYSYDAASQLIGLTY
jgi:YD repeat-containing protein